MHKIFLNLETKKKHSSIPSAQIRFLIPTLPHPRQMRRAIRQRRQKAQRRLHILRRNRYLRLHRSPLRFLRRAQVHPRRTRTRTRSCGRSCSSSGIHARRQRLVRTSNLRMIPHRLRVSPDDGQGRFVAHNAQLAAVVLDSGVERRLARVAETPVLPVSNVNM